MSGQLRSQGDLWGFGLKGGAISDAGKMEGESAEEAMRPARAWR